MIKLNQLSMSYPVETGRLSVLSAANLAVAQGESLAIVGPSGSGKTTLLLLLAGLESPESGEIIIDGQSLAHLNSDQLADRRRDHLGIVFQSFHLVPSLTALGNVALPLEIAGYADARKRAHQMLAKVGLAERESHYPVQLSGGEQQRVAIARALVHQPKLILADEPTGNLDVATGERIRDLLFGLQKEVGATLLLVTHDETMASCCQRIVRLHAGQLMEDASGAISA